MNTVASSPQDKKTRRAELTHALTDALFNDSVQARTLRLAILLLVIFGWGIGGAFIFRSQNTLLAILLHDVPRYLLAPFAAEVGAFLLGARYIQELYQLPGYGSALSYLFTLIFGGLSLPRLSISEGKKNIREGEVNLIERIGGPGWLFVEPGNAVVLERLQEPAAVLGAGVHLISRFQRVKQIISLKDQHWIAPPFRATTKDGIELSIHDFQFGYKLYADHRSDGTSRRTLVDPYPFSVQAARSFTYNRSFYEDGTCMSWGKSVQFRVDKALTDYVNRSTLDQITAPTQPGEGPREKMLRELNNAPIRNLVKNMLGTELLWVKIGRFEVEDARVREMIQQTRLNAWFFQWAGKVPVLRAQGKAALIAQKEGARAETTANMLKSISEALSEANLSTELSENLWNIVLARTAQIIDSMTSTYGPASEDILPGAEGEDKEQKYTEDAGSI